MISTEQMLKKYLSTKPLFSSIHRWSQPVCISSFVILIYIWLSSALFPPRADARPHHLPPTLSGVFARQELHKYLRCGWYNHYSILPAAIKLTKSWSTVQTQRQNTQPSNRKKSESQILRAERKRKRGRFWRKVHLKPLPERKVLKASKESLTTEREEGPRQLVLPSNV